MAATSLLARLGLRIATLGSAASLAIAAPIAEGNVSQTAHTHAARTGFFFPTATTIGIVADGMERLRVNPENIGARLDFIKSGTTTNLYIQNANGADLYGRIVAGSHLIVSATSTHNFPALTISGTHTASAGTQIAVDLSANGATALGVWNDGGVQIGGTFGTSPGAGRFSANHSGVAGNEIIGANAGKTGMTGNNNTIFGSGTAINITTGSQNILIGPSSCAALTDGGRNIVMGHQALSASTNASAMIAIGVNALLDVTGGSNSIYMGYNAGYIAGQVTSPSECIALGGSSYNSGHNSIAVGMLSVAGTKGVTVGHTSKCTSSGATIIGADSGNVAASGTQLTSLGYGNLIGSGAHSSVIAIGYQTFRGSSLAHTVGRIIAIGDGVMNYDATGLRFRSIVIGHGAGVYYSEGERNVIIGTDAGGASNMGSNVIVGDLGGYNRSSIGGCVFIGSGAGQGSADLANGLVCVGNGASASTGVQNSVAIGNNATATKTGQMMLGTSNYLETVLWGNIILGSSIDPNITLVSANTTLDTTHTTVLVDATAGPVTITLPPVFNGSAGKREYRIKKVDASANAVTIAAANPTSDRIDGATTVVLTAQYQSRTLHAHTATASWNII